jgi:hypothetical protein
MALLAIQNIVEAALKQQLSQFLTGVAVLVSDQDAVKVPMPYLVIHVDEYTEEIVPGCGIFKLSATLMLRSHVTEQAVGDRDGWVSLINQFMHQKNAANPASPRLQAAVALSTFPNLYVHGFVPTSGSMKVNADLKAYEYEVRCDLYCKPSSGN